MRNAKCYRLIEAVRNPEYDRRCTYGIRSIGVFPKGTFFLYRPESVHQVGERYHAELEEAQLLWGDTKTHYTGGTIARLLFTSAEPTTAANVWEKLTECDVAPHCADNLLDFAVRRGVLTLDQVATLCAEWERELNDGARD